jgi:acetyl esterase/lipase
MTNYDIHPDFNLYTKVKVILYPKLIPMINKLLNVSTHRVDLIDSIRCEEHSLEISPTHSFPIKIYQPIEAEDNLPAILFYHGGAFTLRGAPHHKQLVMTLAKRLQCKVIWVDYTMSYVKPYPMAINEAYAAYEWVVDQGAKIGIDRDTIAVCGDSAGGNLAAVVALMARDRKKDHIKAQMLIYPVTDARQKTESIKAYEDTPVWDAKLNRTMWKLYIKNEEDITSPYVSPILSKTHDHLPQAYIEVAQYDCLHDEGVAYAKCLESAGVTVEFHDIERAMHGFDVATDSDIVKQCMEQRIAFFEKVFGKR